MRRHHVGSGRRRAVPASWGRDHAPVAATTRNATVTLSHAGTVGDNTDGWSSDARATTPTPDTPYATGTTARIQALTSLRAGSVLAAEESVVEGRYLVTVDLDLPARVGDEVVVTQCPGDVQLLQGESLRVDQVIAGTDRAERDLFCTLI
jgi:hypothetical protein